MKRMDQRVYGVCVGKVVAFVRSPHVCPEHPEHFYSIDKIINKYSYLVSKKRSGGAGTFRNTPERILFRHVPAMFRPALSPEHGCSPYATRLTAIRRKNVFRNVPEAPEHSVSATDPVNQGFQPNTF